MRRPAARTQGRSARRTWIAATAAGLATLTWTTGCGSDEVVAKPATIEQLAAKIEGCKPEFTQGRLKDYRQARCKTPTGIYGLNTFDTDKGEAGWLDYAKIYGGHYLVGPRWVIVGPVPQLRMLRKEIGGDIHNRLTETNMEKPYSPPRD